MFFKEGFHTLLDFDKLLKESRVALNQIRVALIKARYALLDDNRVRSHGFNLLDQLQEMIIGWRRWSRCSRRWRGCWRRVLHRLVALKKIKISVTHVFWKCMDQSTFKKTELRAHFSIAPTFSNQLLRTPLIDTSCGSEPRFLHRHSISALSLLTRKTISSEHTGQTVFDLIKPLS